MSTHGRIVNGSGKRETAQRIIALAYSFREAKAFLSAVELGVFDALANGPLALEALRQRIGLHPRGTRDFLDALVTLGLLDRDTQGRYSNTIASKQHLVRGKPDYVAPRRCAQGGRGLVGPRVIIPTCTPILPKRSRSRQR